jgi:hypothetical protein
MSDNSLERQIKDLMGGLEFKPDAAVWNKVRAEIAPAKKPRVAAWWMFALLLLLAGAGTFILFQTQSSPAHQAATAKTTAPGAGTIALSSVAPATGSVAGAVQEGNTTATTPAGDVFSQQAQVAAQQAGTSSAAIAQVTSSPKGASTTTAAGITPVPGKPLPVRTAAKGHQMITSAGTLAAEPDEPALQASFASPALIFNDYSIIAQEKHLVSQDKLTPALSSQSLPPVAAAPPVIQRKSRSAWQLVPFANAGIATAAVGVSSPVDEAEERAKMLSNMLQTPNSQVSTLEYSKSRFEPGYTFGAGIVAEKQLLGKLKLQTGLRYQYTTYRVTTAYIVDSITRLVSGSFAGALATVPTLYDTKVENYHLHYIGVPVLLQYDLSEPLGITGGIMNDFVLAAKRNKTSIKSDMRSWVPSAYFSFAIKIPGNGKYQWQVMPYVQYSLSNIMKVATDHRLLQPGIQVQLRLK